MKRLITVIFLAVFSIAGTFALNENSLHLGMNTLVLFPKPGTTTTVSRPGIDDDTTFLWHFNTFDNSGHTPAYHFYPKSSNFLTNSVDKKFNEASFQFWAQQTALWIREELQVGYHAFDLQADIVSSWTVEAWIKIEPSEQQQRDYLFEYYGSGDAWRFGYEQDQGFFFEIILEDLDNYGEEIVITSLNSCGGTRAATDNLWHHICLVKVNDEYGIFLDGRQVGYLQDDSTTYFREPFLYIGGNWDDYSNCFSGLMDDCRIIKSNVYNVTLNADLTAYFSVPTEALTADANTRLLLQAEQWETISNRGIVPDGQCETMKSTDAMGDAYGIFWAPGLGSWGVSKYFVDATINQTPFDVTVSNEDDWTVDFWVKMYDGTYWKNSGKQVPFLSRAGGLESSKNYWSIERASNNRLEFKIVENDVETLLVQSTTNWTSTAWAHITLVKKADKYGLYINGTQVAYEQSSVTSTVAGGNLIIGASFTHAWPYWGGVYAGLYGYLDEIRFQHSNWFEASPNASLTDRITVPTEEYSE